MATRAPAITSALQCIPTPFKDLYEDQFLSLPKLLGLGRFSVTSSPRLAISASLGWRQAALQTLLLPPDSMIAVLVPMKALTLPLTPGLRWSTTSLGVGPSIPQGYPRSDTIRRRSGEVIPYGLKFEKQEVWDRMLAYTLVPSPSPPDGLLCWRGVPDDRGNWHISLGSFEQLSEASLSLLPESLFLTPAALGWHLPMKSLCIHFSGCCPGKHMMLPDSTHCSGPHLKEGDVGAWL